MSEAYSSTDQFVSNESNSLRELFSLARELDSSELLDWLDQNCPDQAVRKELEDLLRCDKVASQVPCFKSEPLDFLHDGEPFSRLHVRYKLLSRLDQNNETDHSPIGGMGDVYLAYDQELCREVAVKLIKPDKRWSQANVDRFHQEAQALAKLQHPGTPPLYDHGLSEHGPYLVMKWVQGQTFASYIEKVRKEPNPVSALLPLFQNVCEAVGYAHSQEICHRDLKPTNIMIGNHGEVQVIDWGIAKVLANQSSEANTTNATQSSTEDGKSSVVATLGYSSPEQVRGEATNEQADVFSLGSLLCEILTGEPAFRGESKSRLDLSKAGDLSDARERLNKISAPKELVDLALQCLEPTPENRPKNGDEVAKAVDDYRRGVEERLEKAKIRQARQKWMVGALVAALATVVVLSAFILALINTVSPFLKAWSEAEIAEQAAIGAEGDHWKAWQNAVAKWQIARNLSQGFVFPWWKAEVQERATSAEQNLIWVEKLDSVRIPKYESLTGKKTYMADPKRMHKDYDKAFRDIGVDPIQGNKDKQVQQIRESKLRKRLLIALDDWGLLISNSENEKRLLGLANSLDSDASRCLWRSMVLDNNNKLLEKEVQLMLADLANNEKSVSQERCLFLSQISQRCGQNHLGENLLEATHLRFPDGLWVLLNLAKAAGNNKATSNEAIRFYTAALAKRPESWEMFNDLGAVLARQKKWGKAIVFYRRAIELTTDIAIVYNNLGNALIDQKEVEEAITAYCKAIELEPDYAGAYTNLGNALLRQKKMEEATAAHRKAIELDPDLAEAYANLGNVLLKQKKINEAITVYRKAIKLKPDLAEAYSNLGGALLGQRKIEEAIMACRKAIELEPDYAGAYTNLGNAFADQKKIEEAITAHRKAIELEPDYAVPYTNLGNLLLRQKKIEEAITAHRKAIELEPDWAEAYANLGNALTDQKKVEEAITAYRKAIELEPGLAGAYNNLGNVLFEQKEIEEAITAWCKAIELEPDNAMAHSNLGGVLREQKKFEEAITACRKAIELKPDLVEAHINLGSVLQEQKRLEEAITAYRKAIELTPDDAMVYSNLGSALRDQRQIEEAITAYRKAIELEPDWAEVHCDLGLLLQSEGKLVDALKFLKKGDELGKKQPDWPHPSNQWVAQCELQVGLEEKLLAVLGGQLKPVSEVEQLGFADVCYKTKRLAGSVKLYLEAFKTNPKLGDDRQAQHQYNAACSAALACAKQSRNEPIPTEAEQNQLRTQALEWLRAELLAWKKAQKSDPKMAPTVAQTLDHWLDDSDLAAVRDKAELAKLPTKEREVWEAFWREVSEELKRASEAGR